MTCTNGGCAIQGAPTISAATTYCRPYGGFTGFNSFPPGACGLGKNVGPCCAPPYRLRYIYPPCYGGCGYYGGGFYGYPNYPGYNDGYSFWASPLYY